MRPFLLVVLALPTVASAVPLQLTHTGRILDSGGVPVTGTQVLTFTVYDDQFTGAQQWQEAMSVDLDDGYFSVQLGSTLATPLDADVFDGSLLWVETDVGGSALPRQPIVSVPYALQARNVAGGTVDATSISVDGTPIIDASGTWVGAPVTPDLSSASYDDLQDKPTTLSDIGACGEGQVAKFVGGGWSCGDDIDTDTDTDTTLTDAEVEAIIADDGYALTSSLSTVATSGSYTDLSNAPTLAAVATSGSYTDLADTPLLADVATSGAYADLNGSPTLATVATSGSYNDLSDQPTFPVRLTATGTVAAGNALTLAHGLGSPDIIASGWVLRDGRWKALPIAGCSLCGDGAEGAFVATSNRTISGGLHNFSTFRIDPGVTVTVAGDAPLELLVQGAVDIQGTLTAAGPNGTDGTNSSGWSQCPAPGGQGIGGDGIGGGGNGGSSAKDYCNDPGGSAPTTSCTCGNDGEGTGPGSRGLYGSRGGGGGGGAHASNGSDGAAGDGAGGSGGIAYASVETDVLVGGSGGGSGSAGGGANAPGGGGGAGGGAIKIVASSIAVSGAVVADGGNGGSNTGSGDGGGGGGGAGGAIWFSSGSIDITGSVSAIGGNGGTGGSNAPNGGAGGNGSDGRVRLDAPTISGATTPAALTGLAPGVTDGVPMALQLEQVDDDTLELINTSSNPEELRLILVH